MIKQAAVIRLLRIDMNFDCCNIRTNSHEMKDAVTASCYSQTDSKPNGMLMHEITSSMTRCTSFHSDVYKQIQLAFDRPRQLSKVVVYNLTSRALPDARSLRAYRDYTSGARFDDRKSIAQKKKKAARSKH